MLKFLLAVVLRWVNPTMTADSTYCLPTNDSLKTLDHVEFWGAPQDSAERILAYVPEHRREGLADSISLPLVGTWVVSGIAVSHAGFRACPKTWTINQPPLAVAPPPESIVQWYDIQGRRLRERPTRPGVYMVRRGNGPAKKVIILGP